MGDSVETSWAKLAIKDQSIQGGRPPGVKQDRCENLSWTCTLSAKKGQSSILKVLEDILSTRILYICWIKSRVYSFLQSFILTKLANLLILQKMLAYILSFLLSICLIHFNFAIFPWIIFVIIKKIHILYLFRGGVLIYAVHCMCVYIYIYICVYIQQ